MDAGPRNGCSTVSVKLRDEEIRLLDAVDAIAAITHKDALWFQRH